MKTITETKQHAQLLTVPEAAQRLGISSRKAWQLISEGQLHTVRIGLRSTRIADSEIDAFIKRLQEMATHRN
jgi:excisionase family DNA binding protein